MSDRRRGTAVTSLPLMVSSLTASLVLLLLLLLLPAANSLGGQCGIEGSSLVITPPLLSVNRDKPTREVTVSCGYPEVNNANRKGLKLYRVKNTEMNIVKLVYANVSGLQSNARNSEGQVATGTFNTSLILLLQRASCSDADFLYECYSTSTIGMDTNQVECLKQGLFSVASDPTDIRIKASPSKDYYKVGDDLTLTCSATVRVRGEREREASWVWEMKKPGGEWQRLKNHISLGGLETSKDGCIKIRYTELKSNLRGSDNGKVFRCYVVKGDTSYLDSAAIFKLNVDSFLFGLSTASGTVVLIGIFIILAAVITACVILIRHFLRRNANNERAMYTERVMNRLDKLLRFEHELIGGQLKKKQAESLPPKPEVEPEESSVDPSEVVVHVVVEETPSESSPESVSDVSEASEVTEIEPEQPKDLYGPMLKV